MSAVQAYQPSPYMRVGLQRRKVTALRAADWQISEEEQKHRVREARARIEAKPYIPPKPLLLPVPVIAEPVMPPPEPVSIMPVKKNSVPGEITKSIIYEVLEKHGVAYVDLMSKSRSRKTVKARMECCYELRKRTHMSTPLIGRRLGGMDHSSVLYSLRIHAERNDLPPLKSDFYVKRISVEEELSYVCLHALGMSYRAVAEVKGVSRSIAEGIIRHWRDGHERG